MSFILDALKKSESDRQRNAGPGLHELRMAAPRSRFPLWALVIAGLLAINLVVGLWWLLRGDAADSPSANAPAVAAAAQPAAAAPAAQQPAPSAEAGRTDLERGIYNPADFEPAMEEEPVPAAAPAPQEPVAQPTPPPAAARAPAAQAPARAPATQNLLAREDLVLQGIAVPEVTMSLHVYDQDPSRRFTFINGNRALEGETLPNGVRVEAIAPEGAILNWQGRRFLLPLP